MAADKLDKAAIRALEQAAAGAGAVSLPTEGEYYYYNNFKEFKDQVAGCLDRVQSLLSAVPGAAPPAAGTFADVKDAHEWVTAVLDEALDRVDDSLAASKRDVEVAKQSAAAGMAGASPGETDTGGASTVRGRAAEPSGRPRPGGGEFVSFMNSTMRDRPQDAFEDGVNNANAPFVHNVEHLGGQIDVEAAAAEAAAAAAAGAPRPHPLASCLRDLRYPAWLVEAPAAPYMSASFEDTPFSYIDTVPALEAAAARLAACRELAVDLEAHNYRSFQGFCCLMQLSTRSEDVVVDVLALRPHIGRVLAPIFADPGVVKVLHGSDGDIVWLQRDFGIYVANLFDTGQAARVLSYPGHGLGYLLDRLCGFKADKRWQLADWRVRPLGGEALHYARADTHFLLYCYDRLRQELSAADAAAGQASIEGVPQPLRVELPAEGPGGALGTVLERSRLLCLQQYEREMLREDSFMALYAKLNKSYTDQQLAVFAALYAWRDRVAREEDESTGYVLARSHLLSLTDAAPTTTSQVGRTVGKGAPVAFRRAAEIVAAVKAAKADPSRAVAAREKWRIAAAEAEQAAAQQQQQVERAVPVAMAVPVAARAGAVAAPRADGEEEARSPPRKRAALQPRAIKPLIVGGGGSTAVTNIAPSPAAGGPAATPAAPASLQPKSVKPLHAARTTATTAAAAAVVARTLPPLNSGTQATSAFGSIVGIRAAAGAPGPGAATAVEAVKASFALPFGYAGDRGAAPESVAVKQSRLPHSAAPPVNVAAAPLQKQQQQQQSQRQVVRAALDAMAVENAEHEAEAAGSQQAQQDDVDEEEMDQAPAEEQGGLDLEEFMPLSLSEQFGLKQGRRRRRQQQQAPAAATSVRGRNPPKPQPAVATQAEEKQLRATLVHLGLEEEGDDAAAAEPAEPAEPAGGTSRDGASPVQGLDVAAAKARYDLGIVNPHAAPDPQTAAGRGRGGRGRGRGGRGGGGGRKDKDAPAFPAGKFNPYRAGPDLTGVKVGKRSAVHVRSGNRSISFK